MESELSAVDDITGILRISKVTAQRWCRDRRFPAARIGKSYRIRKDDSGRWYAGKLREHMTVERQAF